MIPDSGLRLAKLRLIHFVAPKIAIVFCEAVEIQAAA